MAEETLSPAPGLLVIGGSSGSIEALLRLLPQLRSDFPIPIIIVLHRNNQSDNTLIELLETRTSLKVKDAEEKDLMEKGCIYIAPADYHLLVEADHTLSLDASAKVNFSRPSIDVSFISASEILGPGLLAILLSGANADGAAALAVIESNGGQVIIQDPGEALVAYMPEQGILKTKMKRVMTVKEMSEYLNSI